ncbi:MAG TPA: hypothetical protein ACFYEK_01430 [Candidatus Wunengus sp. YC60]|uniref:hypothetical protein n=1 Tax=Candidatus Wunengus sp. YC60 TaxID=3367697 RepID=UPI00402826D3
MPEDKTEDGLPIFKKATGNTTEEGLPILKKKISDTTPSPSVSTPVIPEANSQSAAENGMLQSVNTNSELPASTTDLQGSLTAPVLDFETKEPNLLTGASNERKNVSKVPEPLPYKQFEKDAARIKHDQEQATKALKHDKGGITDRFLAGANHLYSNIAEAPAMLWNTAAAITDPIAHALGAEGTGKVEQENAISKHFKDAETYINDVKPKSHDKASLDYLKEGKLADTFSALGNEVAESLPASLGLMMGGAAGAGMKGTAAVGTLVFGADKQAQLDADPNTKDLPDIQKKAISLANGFAEVLFEGNLGISKLGALTKKVLEKSGKEAAEKFAKEGFEKIYSPAIKQWAGIGAENMIQEAGTKFTQNVIDKYWGVDPNIELSSGLAQAALQGLGAHAMMSTAPTLLDVARTKKAADRAHEIIDAKNAIKADIASETSTPEAKVALHGKLRELNAEEADLHQEETQKHEALPDDKKAEVDALHQRLNKISNAIVDPGVSEQSKEIMKGDATKVEGEIEKIYEENKGKKDEAKKVEEEDANTHADFENQFLESLKPKETTQENPESITPKTEENAITERKLEESNIEQHQNGSESRTPTETSGSDRNVESGEVSQEVTPQEQEVKNPALTTPTETKTEEITPEVKQPVKEKPKQELIDEEEQLDAQREDDKASVQKLNDDIAILKGFSDKDVAAKKFKGIIERAFKMKEEKKISKPTYTKYRNQASQVLGPKINLDAEEAKYKVESLKEEVKKKLLGEGYKKVIMSAPGFGPKQVADLIDLTAKLTNHAIDAGYSAKEAVEKALEHIKKHPYYNKLVEGGHLDEKEFSKQIKSTFEAPETTEEAGKTEAKGEGKKPTGEKRKHSIGERIVNNEDKLKEVSARLKEKGIEYESVDQKKATKAINDIIEEHAKDNLLHDLADAIIAGKSDIPYQLQGLAANKLVDKLNVIAEGESNEFLKNSAYDKAAELSVWWMQEATKAGQFNGVANQEIANSLPMSKEGLRTFANKELEKLHDTVLTEKEKASIEQTAKEINEAINEELSSNDLATLQTMVTKEIARIAEKTRGKEFINNLSTMVESLKMDLSEC